MTEQDPIQAVGIERLETEGAKVVCALPTVRCDQMQKRKRTARNLYAAVAEPQHGVIETKPRISTF